MPIIHVIGFACYRCGHQWTPSKMIPHGAKNIKMPTVCPRCKSPFWNRPRLKDIEDIIQSGIYQSYPSTVPLRVFASSHVKKGDDPAVILDCIYSLPTEPPANPKLWLEIKYQELQENKS